MERGNISNLASGSKQSPLSASEALEPDSAPMTARDLQMARRVPRVTTLRRALRMTQEEFAAAFGIPVGTLRDWEQQRAEPDATARAYLSAIAGDADAVARALAAGRRDAGRPDAGRPDAWG